MIIAKDGQEGLDKARTCQIDVILLDMNLPIVDGWTIARALKADEATRSIRIIALTAHAMSGDRQIALDAECNYYHPKPVVFTELLA